MYGQKLIYGLGRSPQQYTPAQLSAMSISGLQAIYADAMNEINYIEADLRRNSNLSPAYQYDQSTLQMIQNNLTQWKALASAVQAWLSLTPQQRARTDGGAFIRNHQLQFQQTQNNLPGFDDLIPDMNFAGLPWYAWLGIIGVGSYLVYELANRK